MCVFYAVKPLVRAMPACCCVALHCVVKNLLANFSLKSLSNAIKEPIYPKIC